MAAFNRPVRSVLLDGLTSNCKIRRYMGFDKFLDLLESQQLYLPQVYQFGVEDKFEGKYTRLVFELAEGISIKCLGTNEVENWTVKKNELYRQMTYIHCWTLVSDDEGDENVALWKLYGKQGNSVAIETTVQHLRDELMKNRFIGTANVEGTLLPIDALLSSTGVSVTKVKYIDYDSRCNELAKRIVLEPLLPFACKHKAFSHEKEVRIICQPPPSIEGQMAGDVTLVGLPSSLLADNAHAADFPCGIMLPVNIEHLLRLIIVSPYADDWFEKLVPRIVERYDLCPSIVATSALSQGPDISPHMSCS